jgi:hypothetical protein
VKKNNPEIEKYRVTPQNAPELEPHWHSNQEYGNNGFFVIPYKNIKLFCMVSDLCGWDHLSVRVEGLKNKKFRKKKRVPNWEEMCFLKNLFWNEEETVVQFHPKASEYVNCHPHVLHLWRDQSTEYKLPPKIMV